MLRHWLESFLISLNSILYRINSIFIAFVIRLNTSLVKEER